MEKLLKANGDLSKLAGALLWRTSCFRCFGLRKQNVGHMWNVDWLRSLRSQSSKGGLVDRTRFTRNQTKIQYLNERRLFKQQLRVFSGMLQRSGIHVPVDFVKFSACQQRLFSTSQVFFNKDENKDDKNKDDEEKMMALLPRLLAWFFVWFWTLFAAYNALKVTIKGDDNSMTRFISWNEFYHDMLAKGEVEEVIVRPEMELAAILLHDGAIIRGLPKEAGVYILKIPDPYRFEEKIRKAEAELGLKPERGIPISYQRENSWGPIVFLVVIGVGAFMVLSTLSKVSLPNPSDMFASARKAKFVRLDVTSMQGKGLGFKEIAGLKEAKVEILEFVDYLKKPERFKELGGKIPRGALLLGPPGCGKTLLARAVATEARVPFLAMAGSEFVEMLGGLGAARVRNLFKEARKRAPCIVYIDEIDAIGRRRGGSTFGANAEEEHTLNQLLVEMDGMGTQEGVIMLAATNRADILDKALLRPGRFDRHISIDLPTMIERKETFDMYLNKLKLAQPPSVYSTKLAQMSVGMSGADIASICNEAALFAAREQKSVIDTVHLDYAVERVVAGVAKKSGLLAPLEKKVVAYHESGHALVGWMLKHTDALLRISIVPRTNSALGFAQYMPSDQKLYSTEELFERMCMALGGRAAEAIIFNQITTGAQDDLQKVTKLAYDQIRSYGMNEQVGPLSFPSSGTEMGAKPYSKKLSALIDQEAQSLIAKAYKYTEKVLKENQDKLHKVATTLMEREVLTYDEMEKLIGPPPYGKKHLLEPDGWKGIMPSDPDPPNDRPPPPPPPPTNESYTAL